MNPPMLKRRTNIPKILWYQDDVKVVLRIMLVDVKKYFLHVDLNHVRFSTIHDDKVYYVSLHFFGAIVPEKTVNENLGREIRIQFVKAHKFLDWLRLEDPAINRITVDPDKIEEEHDKINFKCRPSKVIRRDWDNFPEYKIKNRLNIYPDGDDQSGSDSDDERCNLVADF